MMTKRKCDLRKCNLSFSTFRMKLIAIFRVTDCITDYYSLIAQNTDSTCTCEGLATYIFVFEMQNRLIK